MITMAMIQKYYSTDNQKVWNKVLYQTNLNKKQA